MGRHGTFNYILYDENIVIVVGDDFIVELSNGIRKRFL